MACESHCSEQIEGIKQRHKMLGVAWVFGNEEVVHVGLIKTEIQKLRVLLY